MQNESPILAYQPAIRRRVSRVRWWILLLVAVVCVVLHLADFRTRFGVFELNGKRRYFRPLDRVRIDSLVTADPGPRVTLVGFEYIKLYKSFPYPWHVRVSPIWTVLTPHILFVAFLPRLKRSGVANEAAPRPR